MKIYLKGLIALLALAVFIAGCAPVISKSVLESADRTVEFTVLAKDPDSYRGKTVILGGVVIRVENLEDKTVAEVLDTALDGSLKPVNIDESEGRFIVEFTGFKDPVVYTGRLITVVGKVLGSRSREIGKKLYTYPVIAPVEHYLWRTPAYSNGPISVGIGVGIMHSY